MRSTAGFKQPVDKLPGLYRQFAYRLRQTGPKEPQSNSIASVVSFAAFPHPRFLRSFVGLFGWGGNSGCSETLTRDIKKKYRHER